MGLFCNCQDLLLFRKFGGQLFYEYCPSFCGQIFERSANLGPSIPIFWSKQVLRAVRAERVPEDTPLGGQRERTPTPTLSIINTNKIITTKWRIKWSEKRTTTKVCLRMLIQGRKLAFLKVVASSHRQETTENQKTCDKLSLHFKIVSSSSS